MLARLREVLRDPQWALLMYLWRRDRRRARAEYLRRLDHACMMSNRSRP
jgi:hypothetical protein